MPDGDATSTVQVELSDRSYPVRIGRGILDSAGEQIREAWPAGGSRIVIMTDSNVGPLYAEQVAAGLTRCGFTPDIITVPAGEVSKSMSVAEDVCRQMIRLGHDRGSGLVALGGGVVGDLGGFVAAIFFRGIDYCQIPTTIVAQVDSSVGGKTGVNAPEGKNLIGAFLQPKLVLADTDLLATLPAREYNEGFAEVIKHAAIKDASLLGPTAAAVERDPGCLPDLIRRNVEIKAQVVAEDERELSGARALLNFGHTIGHAIEATAGYGKMLHGEAISLGLAAACKISVERFGLPQSEADQVISALRSFDLPLKLGAEFSEKAILEALARDKKFAAGQIRFVVLEQLGMARLSDEVTLEDIRGAIAYLR